MSDIPPPPCAPPDLKEVNTADVDSNEEIHEVKLNKVSEDKKFYTDLFQIYKEHRMYEKEKPLPRKKNFENPKNMKWKQWHGALGSEDWPHPRCAVKTNKANRPDQGNRTNASEYLDSKDVLSKKMKIVAELIRKSKFTVVYTGAGISRGAGIADYASVASKSIMKNIKKVKNAAYALPTYAHYALALMEKQNLIQLYIQQNHDGLPQKSGFPQHKMNEIHGSWFDPSNPVVPMSGNLRGDLISGVCRVEKKIEFTLVLGTSLSGMNCDRVVWTPCEKFHVQNTKKVSTEVENNQCFGSVIVNLQMTPVDQYCGYVPIRVWAKIDDAMDSLMEHLNIEFSNKVEFDRNRSVIGCSYDEKGKKLNLDDVEKNENNENSKNSKKKKKRMILNLRSGKKIKIVQPGAVNYGEEGFVMGRDDHGHILINFRKQGRVRRLGYWWLSAIEDGKMERIPIVNTEVKYLEDDERVDYITGKVSKVEKEKEKDEGEGEKEKAEVRDWGKKVSKCEEIESEGEEIDSDDDETAWSD